jgi:hypothetical protein
MDLNFALDGIIQVSMIAYTTKVTSDFPESINTSCTSPTGDHLFIVQDALEPEFLHKKQAQAFHHTVAQILFLCKHTHRDIQTTIPFLTTRVKRPDEDNWGKLKRVLQYLCGTCHMKLNLSTNNLTIICWWVNTSHAPHDDCLGHIGAMMSLGKGATISFSNKLMTTTKSSTKSELVCADQALSSILHTC